MTYPNIEAERGRLGMDKATFAKFIGVSVPTYRGWITGKRKLPADVVVKLAQKLHVTTDYLLGVE